MGGRQGALAGDSDGSPWSPPHPSVPVGSWVRALWVWSLAREDFHGEVGYVLATSAAPQEDGHLLHL